MRKTKILNQIFSSILVVCMLVCLIPTHVMADAPDSSDAQDAIIIEPSLTPEVTDGLNESVPEVEVPAPDVPEEEQTEDAEAPDTMPEDSGNEPDIVPEETEEPEEPDSMTETPESTEEPEDVPEKEPEETEEEVEDPEIPLEEIIEEKLYEIVDPETLDFSGFSQFSVPALYTHQYTVYDRADIHAVIYTMENALPEGAVPQISDPIPVQGYEYDMLQESSAGFDGAVSFQIGFTLNGEEVEPVGGAYVVLECVGVLPEDADSSSVQILHIPNQSPANQLNSLAATLMSAEVIPEDVQAEISMLDSVMSAAFNVGSFSSFVVTWNNGATVAASLTVKYVDKNGKNLDLIAPQNLAVKQSTVIDVTEFALNNHINAKKYEFKKAYLNKNTIVQKIKYDKSTDTLLYLNDTAEWIEMAPDKNKQYVLFLEYAQIKKNSGKIVIDTVNNIYENIKIGMFNYGETPSNQDGNVFAEDTASKEYNKGHALQFSGGGGRGARDPNRWTGNSGGGVYEGIVQQELGPDGFPVINFGSNKESLKYLFSGGHKDVFAYNETNGLLQKTSDGYYYFDSHQNFAEFDKKTQIFTLYNENQGVASGARMPAYFMPFNQFSKTQPNTANDQLGNDYHFGMSIGFDFMLTGNGTINGKPLIFEFSGDDDFWVFIDGKLVLDMGGIHNSYDGQIDFSTGHSKVFEEGSTTTALHDYTLESLLGPNWRDKKTHSFKAFYMERGAHASNCKFKFNMVPIPKNQLTIGKSFGPAQGSTQEEVDEIVANYRYRFQTFVSDANGKATTELFIQPGTEYKILYKGIDTGKTGIVGDDGSFVLSVHESAKFDTSLLEGKYVVREMIESDRYEGQFDGMSFTIEHLGGVSKEAEGTKTPVQGNFTGFDSNAFDSENSSDVTFTNKVITQALSRLKIKKIVRSSDASLLNQEYVFNVIIDGEPIRIGTVYDVTTDGGSIVKRKAEQAGEIKIRNGETATLDILKGSTFEVTEKTTGAFTTSYDLQINGVSVPTSGKAAGTISEVQSIAMVTVTNATEEPFDPDILPQTGGYGTLWIRLTGFLGCLTGFFILKKKKAEADS